MTRITITFLFCLVVATGCSTDIANVSTDNETYNFTGGFYSPRIVRELNYYVANYSSYSTNHFYVVATELDRTNMLEGLVYWNEEREIELYDELYTNATVDAQAWRNRHWKLGRDTVETRDEINGSDYLITSSDWRDWTNQCLSKGQHYVVLKTNAQRMFPKDDN